MTLTEFLEARIAEDEAAARSAALWSDLMVGLGGGPMSNFGRRFDPARVLAECEAKRRIVALHESWPVLVQTQPEFERADPSDPSSMTFRMSQQIAWTTEREYRAKFGDEPPTGPVLRDLAQPYADHPDFHPAWA